MSESNFVKSDNSIWLVWMGWSSFGAFCRPLRRMSTGRSWPKYYSAHS